MLYFNSPGNRPNRLSPASVQKITTSGVLRGVWSTSDYHNRERPPRKRTRVLVFILTATTTTDTRSNHHASAFKNLHLAIGSGISLNRVKTLQGARCDTQPGDVKSIGTNN